MRTRVILVRHGDDPPDDRVYSHLHINGFSPVVVRPYAGEAIPEIDERTAGAVVYGGPFNAYDLDIHPFLSDEARLIEQCIGRDLPLLGICQGAQQIAHTLGANAGPKPGAPFEFGYYRVDPVDPAAGFMAEPLWLTQAHFHMFDIPAGAVRLAESELFENQAFRYGARTYALQFHAEVTIEVFRRWQSGHWASYYGNPGAQEPDEQTRLGLQHDAKQAAWFKGFMDGLFPPEQRS